MLVPLKMDSIPPLQFDELMPPPTRSPQSPRLGSPMYSQSNSSTGSLTKSKGTSLNYVPSLAQPPPPSISHSHSGSLSSMRRSRSPIRAKSPIRSPSPIRGESPIRQVNPFNFKSTSFPMQHGNGSQNSLSVPGSNKTQYRRGHRYKHSSVSMNLFQEPPKRAPLNVKEHFSIPNLGEVVKSLTSIQKIKLAWCSVHIFSVIALFVIGIKFNNSVLLTLSHLCFYDMMSNLIVVIVDIMTNFQCWTNSSLQYPFGLGRIEVLIGFGLSVSLIFVGGDLISHLLEEIIINLIIGDTNDNEDRIHHSHNSSSDSNTLSSFNFELLIIFTVILTVVSSNLLLSTKKLSFTNSLFSKNHLIKSSTNLLTLLYASYSFLYPLVSHFEHFEHLNDLSTLFIALLICNIAWRLIKSLSFILLISYPFDTKSFSESVTRLSNGIQDLPDFKSNYKIDKIIISKVNYQIYIVIVKIKMFGSTDDDESKMRYYITRLIKQVLLDAESGYQDKDSDDVLDDSNTKFEITIAIDKF